MSQSFEYQRRVEFRDTDMAGIVHFSVFFSYMEEAEHEFLRFIGLGVFFDVDGQHISWPRVAAECNYRSSIRFEDELSIHVSIARIGSKSVTYRHEVRCGETLVADGKVTAVCCRMVPDGKPQSIEIPSNVRKRLTPFAPDSDE